MSPARRPAASVSFAALDVALETHPPVDDRLVHQVRLDAIRPSPRNPRQHVGAVDELADSLREHGLLQPIVIRRRNRGYELIAGHRRYTAAEQLGWTEIAAVVRDETDDQAYILTLVENLQREDLSPKEEAAALEVLVRERGWTTRQVGEAIKRGPMYVSRRLRVFDDEALAPLVLADQMPVSTAEELLVIADVDRRRALAQQAADERWERPQVREAVRSCIAAIQNPAPRLASHIRALTKELAPLSRDSLTPRTRRDLAQLLAVVQQLS